MDPIVSNLQLKYSFSQDRIPETINTDALSWFTIPLQQARDIILRERLVPVEISSLSRSSFSHDTSRNTLKLTNCDAQKYIDLLNLKDKFNNPNFVTSRNKCNPYEKLGRSIFGNRAAVKLANIDALYNLTGIFNEYTVDLPSYTYCDIASAPGSWSEYLQYRRPQSQGYAMSIRSPEKSLNFDTSRLNMKNIRLEYGPDDTGNLYTNHLFFANLVRQENSEGVDLVMADGGFELENREDFQEILSSRLILTEVLIALKCLKENGKLLCKMFDTVLPVTQDIIYITVLCFNRISIIKPVSSRPANSELYLIGDGYRSDIGMKYIPMIEKILVKYDEANNSGYSVNSLGLVSPENVIIKNKLDIMFSNLFDTISSILSPVIGGIIPESTEQLLGDVEFHSFMRDINNFSIQNQTENAKGIIDAMNGKLVIIPELNLHMAFLLWKIPGNINTQRKVYNSTQKIQEEKQSFVPSFLPTLPSFQF